MKVSVDISDEYKEPYAVIYTNTVTDEIQRIIDVFSSNETPVTALKNEEEIVFLQPKEIYMDSIEGGFSGTLLLTLKNGCKDYVSRKYLPGFKKYLGL